MYLVDVITGERQLLLPKALFVQWVIQSDVVVSQTDDNLEIWYNIDMPEHKTSVPVRGEVTEIVRGNVCIHFLSNNVEQILSHLSYSIHHTRSLCCVFASIHLQIFVLIAG